MSLGQRFSVLVVLVISSQSFALYRNRLTVTNSIFYPPAIPGAYFAGGDVATSCEAFTDEVDDALRFCEDETFWDIFDSADRLEERNVLITCDAGRKEWNTVMGPFINPEPHGTLWMYPTAPKAAAEVASSFFGSKKKTVPVVARPKRVTFENYPDGHDFHPLGIKIYPSFGGNASNVYIINHARQRTFIEQFTMSPSAPTTITHVRTLSSPFFVSPNALALTSPDSFYVTNDHLMTRRLPIVGHVLPIVETVFGLPLSWTAHVILDPHVAALRAIKSHTVAAPFVSFSNGISISPSGERVAIASTATSSVLFYARNASTNTLTFEEGVHVPFVPDNIDYDDDANLIVTGHPDFPGLIKVVKSRVPYAPSWAVKLSPREGEVVPESVMDAEAPVSANGMVPKSSTTEVTTLFQSNGSLHSSSSTTLRDARSGNIYMTGLYGEPGFMVCKPHVD